jgi:hypothetical protein
MPFCVRILALVAAFHGACACAASLIAPGTYLIEGETTANRQPDGNSIVIAAPAGLIVFDTGRHLEHARQVLDFACARRSPASASTRVRRSTPPARDFSPNTGRNC